MFRREPVSDVKKRRHATGRISLAVEPVARGAVAHELAFAPRQCDAPWPTSRDHLIAPGNLVEIGVEDAVRIGRGSTPFEPPVRAREQDRFLHAGRRKRAERSSPLQPFRRQCASFRRDVRDVVWRSRSGGSTAPASRGTAASARWSSLEFSTGARRARESATAACPSPGRTRTAVRASCPGRRHQSSARCE